MRSVPPFLYYTVKCNEVGGLRYFSFWIWNTSLQDLKSHIHILWMQRIRDTVVNQFTDEYTIRVFNIKMTGVAVLPFEDLVRWKTAATWYPIFTNSFCFILAIVLQMFQEIKRCK